MPLKYNVDKKPQFVTINSSPELNPQSEVTFEAVCELYENGLDPTVIARPAGVKWVLPYVVYRIGFFWASRLPEFQLLFEDESTVTTIRGERPVKLNQTFHFAGVYDGESMRLYIDGMLVASKKKTGKLSTSDQSTVFATRSSSDPGGLFIGTLQEFRMWKIARTEEVINLWKHRLLPTKPSNSGLIGLWSGEPGPPSEAYDYLLGEGFSQDEVFLLYFAYWYSRLYNQQAKSILTDKARKYYSEYIRWVLFVRAKDGYFALYFPEFAEGMNPDMVDESGMQPGREVMILDQREKTVTELIQSSTGNYLKVLFPPLGKSMREPWKLPDDIPDASDENISPSLRKYEVDLPKLTISAAANVEDGIISSIRPGRIRAVSPLIQDSDGSFKRQFTWVFLTFGLGNSLAMSSIFRILSTSFLLIFKHYSGSSTSDCHLKKTLTMGQTRQLLQ